MFVSIHYVGVNQKLCRVRSLGQLLAGCRRHGNKREKREDRTLSARKSGDEGDGLPKNMRKYSILSYG
jgi:hypothetical protein